MNTVAAPKIISRRREILICLILVFATLAVYWPVRYFDFVNIDDWSYVTQNAEVQRGLSWENLRWAFVTTYAGNWHPLTTLSHMLDCQIYGLEAGGAHLTNLFFHLGNTLLLFALLRRMTGALWRSAFVAALFALHPLHVESVAWISERKDVLSGFFFLLTLWFYDGYQRVVTQNLKLKIQNYSLALICFALGLLSKPMLVTLPFVLLLLDYWPLQRISVSDFSTRKALNLFLEKIPFFALAAASCLVTFFAQKGGGAVVALKHFPLLPRLGNALVSYVRYLGKTVWPKSLAVFYPFEGAWATWQILGAILLLATLTFFSIRLARRRPYFFVGWFWFLGMFVPVIGLVQVGAQSMADRYTYLPHLGIFIALTWAFFELAEKFSARLVTSVAALLISACGVVTARQVQHWRNTETLLTHAVAVTRGNAPAHYYLAVVLEAQGKTNEAFTHFAQAAQDNPHFTEAHVALATILERQKKTAEARAAYAKALQIQADFAPAHYGLAGLLAKDGKKTEATIHYEAAIRAQPDFAEAHYQLAVLFAEEKKIAEAIAQFKAAIRLKPDWLEPLNNLAWILATERQEQLRDGKLASELAGRAARLTKWKNPGVLDTLAASEAETGQYSDAVAVAEKAVALATAARQPKLAAEIQERVKLYRQNSPYHEP